MARLEFDKGGVIGGRSLVEEDRDRNEQQNILHIQHTMSYTHAPTSTHELSSCLLPEGFPPLAAEKAKWNTQTT